MGTTLNIVSTDESSDESSATDTSPRDLRVLIEIQRRLVIEEQIRLERLVQELKGRLKGADREIERILADLLRGYFPGIIRWNHPWYKVKLKWGSDPVMVIIELDFARRALKASDGAEVIKSAKEALAPVLLMPVDYIEIIIKDRQ